MTCYGNVQPLGDGISPPDNRLYIWKDGRIHYGAEPEELNNCFNLWGEGRKILDESFKDPKPSDAFFKVRDHVGESEHRSERVNQLKSQFIYRPPNQDLATRYEKMKKILKDSWDQSTIDTRFKQKENKMFKLFKQKETNPWKMVDPYAYNGCTVSDSAREIKAKYDAEHQTHIGQLKASHAEQIASYNRATLQAQSSEQLAKQTKDLEIARVRSEKDHAISSMNEKLTFLTRAYEEIQRAHLAAQSEILRLRAQLEDKRKPYISDYEDEIDHLEALVQLWKKKTLEFDAIPVRAKNGK